MDEDVLDILEQLGYTGLLLEPAKLSEAVKGGPKSVEYTQLVEWLSKELRILCKLEDNVNAISSPDDSSSFLLEVSSFLKELNCPYESLLKDNVNQRLQSVEDRILLLVYLGSELQAARINSFNESSTSKGIEVGVSESETARSLKAMLISLAVSKPPVNITPKQLFAKTEEKVKERMNGLPPEVLNKPLFQGLLSLHQWNALSQLHKEMFDDYTLRRQMLLKRLDVTIQSFQWSGKAKDSQDAIAAKFGPFRRQLNEEPNVSISSLLAAREDLAILEKTSSSTVRKNTKSEINKVLIGRVPDRGGRPNEQQPPPPEMPSWQKRSDPGQGGRGAGGGGRGSGRVQGGWSGVQGGGGGYQQDRGGHQQRGGGYQKDRGSGYQQGGGYQQDKGSGYQQNGGYQQSGYQQSGGYEQRGGGYHQGGSGGGGYYQGNDNCNQGGSDYHHQGGGGYNQGGGHRQSGGGGYNQRSGHRQRGGGRGGRGGGRYQDYNNQGNYGYSQY